MHDSEGGKGEEKNNTKCKMKEEIRVSIMDKELDLFAFSLYMGRFPPIWLNPAENGAKRIEGNEDGIQSDNQVIRVFFINILVISNKQKSVFIE